MHGFLTLEEGSRKWESEKETMKSVRMRPCEQESTCQCLFQKCKNEAKNQGISANKNLRKQESRFLPRVESRSNSALTRLWCLALWDLFQISVLHNYKITHLYCLRYLDLGNLLLQQKRINEAFLHDTIFKTLAKAPWDIGNMVLETCE